MRTLKEILRLKWSEKLSNRKIARSCHIGHSTVADYLYRARKAGLSWPLPEELDDIKLEQLLFPPSESISRSERREPDWQEIHQELKRKGVTLFLLWQEYKEICPEGFQYSRFCERYRQWTSTLDVCMRQNHKAGEKMFVDYAGQTVPIVDRQTGEVKKAQIFVAILGASNYTYTEATWTQSLPDWIASHIRAWEFMQGVAALTIPDNIKTGISEACYYEPDLNATYHELSQHYQTAILPARVRKPRDKAKVETGVQGVEQRILAPLRHRTFFSLTDLNQAIRELLVEYNQRPFQKLPGSRQSLFEELEQPVLKPLPAQRYEYAEWKTATVNIDYHVEVDRHYYSVPYKLVRKRVEVRLTATVVECFHNGKRVASHLRSFEKGRHTTLKEHMPKGHLEYLEWTPERIVKWAAKTGGATAEVVKYIMVSRAHPQQGFRSCLGIMRLGKLHGTNRLEAACVRAKAINAMSYKSIASILKHGLDKCPLPEKPPASLNLRHDNVRGPEYYQIEN